jgi:glycine cleavage system H protein
VSEKGTKREGKKASPGEGIPAGGDWVVLPCNGLDKEAGALAREMALHMTNDGGSLICPVLYGRNPSRYERELAGGSLLVIDGCKTSCASKLAKEGGLKIARRLNISEILKDIGLKGGKAPVPDPEKLSRLLEALGDYEREREDGEAEVTTDIFTAPVELREFMVEKFVFRVPVSGYFFNDNDCWARVEGTRARIGVSDYVQQSASDMVFFEPPALGSEIAQFDDAGSLESTKTALDIISPVSGKVVAINGELVEAPELINEDPYVRGWAVEVELEDFEEDRELLMDCDRYFGYLQDKAEREYREKYSE